MRKNIFKRILTFYITILFIYISFPIVTQNNEVIAESGSPGELIHTIFNSLSGEGDTYYTNFDGTFGKYTIVMAGNSEADFDLYAKWGSAPTISSYDKRGYTSNSLEYFSTEGSGYLYLMVRSYSGSGVFKLWAITGDNFVDDVKYNGYLSSSIDSANYVSSHNSLSIDFVFLSGPDASDFDLYIRWESPPTTSTYDDCGVSGYSIEKCESEGNGKLYYMVDSYSGYGYYNVLFFHFPIDEEKYTLIKEEMSIDSPHNYPIFETRFKKIERPSAYRIRIHFSKIEIQSCKDSLKIQNRPGDTIWQSETNDIGKKTYINFWSPWVSGNFVRLKLSSNDDDITYWGFRIDKIEWERIMIESLHPYTNYENSNWYFTSSYHNKIRIKFNVLDVERTWDHLYIRDENNQLKWTYTNDESDLPQYDVTTPWITGNTIKITLNTDISVTKYGFEVEEIECDIGDDDNKLEISLLAVANYDSWDLDNLDFEAINGYYKIFVKIIGWIPTQNERDSNVIANNFYDDADESDLLVFSGHGGTDFIWNTGQCLLKGYNFCWDLSDEHNLGSEDFEWAIFSCCDVLSKWGSREMLFHGGHAILGFDRSLKIDDTHGKFFEYAYINKYTIQSAWSAACRDLKLKGCTTMTHTQNINDHLWGCGRVYPDSSSENDIIWLSWP